VWGFPCESKSSPAHYSKHPQLNSWGCFFMSELNDGNKALGIKGKVE
jgi:hypothetical protein